MQRDKLVSTLQQVRTLIDGCLDALKQKSSVKSNQVSTRSSKSVSAEVDFTKPLRPFVKAYGQKLGGAKKFVLLTSWLAKGGLNAQVKLSEVEQRWSRMQSLLELEFNRFFPAQAKDNDWVETKKTGLYNLRPNWREALRSRSRT